MEIINGVERRRHWRDEDKLRILAEIDGGAKLNDVARRHDVSRGLLWQWREAQRRGRLAAEAPTFVPLRVVPELPGPGPREMAAPSSVGAEGASCIGRSNFRPPGGVKPGHSGAPRPTS